MREFTMQRYIALLHAGRRGGYGVSFPDFPGCISGGDSLAKALTNGTAALRLHVEAMRADGDPIPAPREFEAIRADPDLAEEITGAIVAPVPLLPPKGRAVRIQVSIDDQLLAAIDAEAARRGLSRSGFLAEAAQLVLSPA
jgi:predicted RNase H-like HicB family nuclease